MRCLFTCRHLLNSSDLLFKMFFLRPLRISNFSSRQKAAFSWSRSACWNLPDDVPCYCVFALVVWKLKDNKRENTIAWDIIRQIPTRGTGPRKCHLGLEEKLLILKGRRKNILNKRSELFNKCRHVNKHLTWAHVTCK